MTILEKQKYDMFLKEYGDEDKAFDEFLRWKCLTDLFFLGYEILGLKGIKDRTGKSIVDVEFHTWLTRCMQVEGSKLIIVPRRHCKSTWVKVSIIQDILLNPDIRIGLFSSTADLVEQMMNDIKKMFCTPLLRRLFSEQIPDPGKKYIKWEKCTANALTIRRSSSTRSPQENQLEAFGVGANVTGKHFDKHYYDDLVTRDTVQTQQRLNKTREWYSYAQGVLEPGGDEVMTGTPYHYSDLYRTVEDEGFYENVFKRSAIESGKPIYKFFTLKELERLRKRMGDYVFSCQYLCNPIPKEDQIFPPPQPTFGALPAGIYKYYITIDPAATVKDYSDQTAFCVAAINERGTVYIVDCFGVKVRGEEIAKKLIKLAIIYKPMRIGIEFGLQEHLQYIIDNEKSKWQEEHQTQLNLPISSIRLSAKQSKYDKINLTLGSFVREGRVFIHESLRGLMSQMENLSPNYSGHDDLVDACSMVFQVAEQFGFMYNKRRSDPELILKDWFTIEELQKMNTRSVREDMFVH